MSNKRFFKAVINHNGFLTEAPIYENHHRGKNAFSVLMPSKKDAHAYNLDQYLPTDGLHLYDMAAVMRKHGDMLGMAIEFKADYMTGALALVEKRWHGVVVAYEDTGKEKEVRIVFKKYPSARDAFQASYEFLQRKKELEQLIAKGEEANV